MPAYRLPYRCRCGCFRRRRLEDLSRRDDDFAVTFGAGVAQDFNAPLQEILAIRRPAVVFAEDCTDITELEQLVRAREFAGCRFDERQRHIRPQDQDTAIGVDGLDHLLAELWKEVLVYIVIFKLGVSIILQPWFIMTEMIFPWIRS